MEWFILSRDMHVLCAPSTDSPNSLPIFDDKQTILLSNNTVVSTYDFSIQQKHPDAQYLKMGNYIVFVDKYHKTKMYTLMSHDGDDLTHTWHAEDVGLDLINESSEKWDYTGHPHDIAWYLNNLVLGDSGWTIGINEASTLTRALKFDGETDTQLRRLGDIANQFDGAEVDFTIEMNGAHVTKQVVNIYKKVGSSVTQGRYIDSLNLTSLHSSGSIADLVTALKPFGSQMDMPEGQEGEAPRINIADVVYDDGRYYSPKGHVYLYDREAHQQWSRFRAYNYANQGEFDGYIVGSYTYDTKDPNELLNRTLTELKSRNKPSETYEANLLDINADIGDYVQIAHNQYNPPIYLSARVESVTNCYTANGQDTGVLGDYRELESHIDPRVQNMIDALRNQIKSNYTWIRYAKDDKGTGMTSTPTADTKYVAIVSNKPTAVPSDNPADYAGHWQLIQGQDGKDGIPGATGADGKTSYTHFAYANNVSGTADFSLDDPTGRSYMGVYSDFTKVDSTNPSDYVWSYTKGETGPEGMQGAQGPQGDIGIPGKPGADGKTSYTHVAYADNDEGGGFSQLPANKAYMGWYTDFTANDSTDLTRYAWSLIKGSDGLDGAQGITGPKGADGKTPYTHIAYADTATGGGLSQLPDGKKYIGMYVDFTENDSGDSTKYAWSLIKGADGKDGTPGKDGIAGKPGADGKTPYFHTAWATSADGKNGFSLTDSANKSYLGTYTDFTQADSTDTTKYAWSLIKGRDGSNGAPGKAGTDGKTPYFHQAWADSKDGKINFSTTDPTNRGYLGTYSDFTQADSTDPTKYFWVELVGAIEIGTTNLVYNAGFQGDYNGGLDGWIKEGSDKYYMTNATLYKGSHSGAINVKATVDQWWVLGSKPVTVATGSRISISGVSFTGGGSNPTSVGAEIGCYDSSGKHFANIGGVGIAATKNTWVPFKVENVSLPADTVKISFRYITHVQPNNQINQYISQPQMVVSDHALPFRDNQGAGADTSQISQQLVDTNNKIASVPVVSTQAGAPTNPKKGDQWWVKDANGNINTFKIWDGTKWADSIIQQSAMNIGTLNGNKINGATINGSEFTNNFDYRGQDNNHFQGVTQIKDGSVNITWKFPENNQTGNTSLDASGLESIIRDSKGAIARSARLQMGELQLGDGRVSGWLNEQDVYQNYTNQVQYLDGWSGWNNPISITRRGKMVTFSGYIAHNGGSAHVNIAQFPAWARPEHNEFIVEIHFGGDTGTRTNGYGNLMLSTGGRLIINRGLGTGQHASFGYTFVGQDI